MASEFDISQSAAGIYADSLLQLATEAGQAEVVGQELADLETLWRQEPGFAAMMSSAAIDDDTRRESIKRIFGGKLSQLTLNTLLVLNDKGRSMILPVMISAYRKRLSKQLGRQTAFVTTAIPLDEAARQKLRAEIKRISGHEAELSERVDPDLLGGMAVQIGDRLYDTSVRRRIRKLRGDLLASIEQHMLQGTARFVTEG